MADWMVWPSSLSRDQKWSHVTQCTHSRVVGLRLEVHSHGELSANCLVNEISANCFFRETSIVVRCCFTLGRGRGSCPPPNLSLAPNLWLVRYTLNPMTVEVIRPWTGAWLLCWKLVKDPPITVRLKWTPANSRVSYRLQTYQHSPLTPRCPSSASG